MSSAPLCIAPNSNGILRRVGIYAEKLGANLMERLTEYDVSGNVKMQKELIEPNKVWQHPWHLCYRVHLHQEMKRRATSANDEGIPAVLKTRSKVSSVDPSIATVVLEGGERIQGDLVIGADARTAVPGGNIKPKPSGKSAFRFLVSRQAALDDPKTAKFAQNNGEFLLWFGSDRRVVMHPCSNNKQLNFVCIHPREESEVKNGEGWNQQSNKAKLLDVYRSFNPALLALLDKADAETLRVWELFDMDVLPTWVNDKLALLGDAAHPFLPHQGQGAGVAMEDAAALAVVLPRDTRLEDIPERLKLYESPRYERANRIQEYSRIAGRDIGERSIDMMEYSTYNFGHDEWDHSTEKFRQWGWSQKPNLFWRMPISFGPMPGPRQDFFGMPRDPTYSTFVTASFKFKTSRTLLQNLLPTAAFKFTSPGTVAYASFSQTTLNGMHWLGGGGYRHFGLYIHGVQYTRKDGSVVHGTYLPILFENLTDPIVSGREELGMPKLYCAIEIHQRTHSYHIQASWQGVSFCDLALEGLREVGPGSEAGTIGGEADDGILAYKYIPRVGERGKADVEHATFVPHAEESKVVPSKVNKVRKASSASIKFESRDWEALPTLHHVVSRLAEIPVYEVVGAKVVEGNGGIDMSQNSDLPPIKRFITSHTPGGKTTFIDTISEEAPFKTLPDGAKFALSYATNRFPVSLTNDADLTTYSHYTQNLPGITISTGTVLRVVDMKPGALSPMHRTVSLDYGVVLEGEVELVLDSGETRLLKRGDIAVQRGTNHAWRNTSSTSWARMLYVHQPAEPLIVGGVKLEEDTSTIPGVR
ncbi:FAD-binding domain-containing protein, partial [Zopfia rhizophila CBS 207.26]